MTEDIQAVKLNSLTYTDYFDRLKILATTIFRWDGIDELCGFGASAMLEDYLFNYGRCAFIKHPSLGYMILACNPSDKLNIYYLPEKLLCWSTGITYECSLDECVYIRNNISCKPTIDTITLMALRLYEVERTLDVNVKAQKTPVVIEGTTKAKLTLENLYKKYTGNSPIIYGRKDFDINNKLNVLDTKAPILLKELEDYKHEVLNDVCTFLGINNNNIMKKERLLVDEVNANNSMIDHFLLTYYMTRKQACDEINKKFFNGEEKVKILINERRENKTESDGDGDGEIYDNNQTSTRE